MLSTQISLPSATDRLFCSPRKTFLCDDHLPARRPLAALHEKPCSPLCSHLLISFAISSIFFLAASGRSAYRVSGVISCGWPAAAAAGAAPNSDPAAAGAGAALPNAPNAEGAGAAAAGAAPNAPPKAEGAGAAAAGVPKVPPKAEGAGAGCAAPNPNAEAGAAAVGAAAGAGCAAPKRLVVPGAGAGVAPKLM